MARQPTKKEKAAILYSSIYVGKNAMGVQEKMFTEPLGQKILSIGNVGPKRQKLHTENTTNITRAGRLCPGTKHFTVSAIGFYFPRLMDLREITEKAYWSMNICGRRVAQAPLRFAELGSSPGDLFARLPHPDVIGKDDDYAVIFGIGPGLKYTGEPFLLRCALHGSETPESP